jgi:putative PIN family toxin of toxin-antitoxin system
VVVLDTNTVLDWLVFRDPAVGALAAALKGGTVQWLACLRMRRELEEVLGYASLARWNPDRERALASFDAYACLVAEPPVPSPWLRCTDPDDQVFIDLALSAQAQWLISHDRALLKLARRARTQGVRIVPPAQWVAPG